MTDLLFDGRKAIRLTKWKVKVGSRVGQAGALLFLYREIDFDLDQSGEERRYKSNSTGLIVTEIVKNEGEMVMPGEAILRYQACPHDEVMKDLCASCGANISILDESVRRRVALATNVSVVHSVPELRVSKAKAESLGRADEKRLLKDRKLALLVDLDQTIIHTTNHHVNAYLKDIHHFQLYGPNTMWYHTKFRPYTMEFLEKIVKLYELHICTFGARRYAHEIATRLDPKERFFPKDRILSRDECFDPYSKTGNMKNLFPCGDSMVCIIDDREDVWNFTPNLVLVKPYIFFKETGDINAPDKVNSACLADQEKVQSISEMTEIHFQNEEEIGDETNKDLESDDKDFISSEDVLFIENFLSEDNSKAIDEEKVDESEINCVSEESKKDDIDKANPEVLKLIENKNNHQDDDDYLLHLEEILFKIHDEYYKMYDEKVKYKAEGEEIRLPDLKEILPQVKKRVLNGVNIVFSGVIPTNLPPEKSKLYNIAKSFGANVTNDIITDGSPKTTHLVAGRWGTAKVNKCIKTKNIFIVNPNWLYTCAERWERVEERLFQLDKSDDFTWKQKKTQSNEEIGLKKVNEPATRVVKNEFDCPVYDQMTGKRIRKE